MQKACCLANPQVAIGFTDCMIKTWKTPAGSILIGCKDHCRTKRPKTGTQCLTFPNEAIRYAKQNVSYTCILGECDEKQMCNPIDLLISCSTTQQSQREIDDTWISSVFH
uniref:Evasin n=1 Tax=Rhipicephalus pulchellus TaxID=72859 RepID=L7MCB4_RHIPC